jgi:2-(1,2-epoxy-1,2-dihydrophenyl)acetyl-CoA isomerase
MGAESTGDERVLLDVTDRLATVTLNRADKLNPIDFATYEILDSLSASLSARDDVGAVVLTGAGRAFSAGADLTEFAEKMDFDDVHAVRERLQYVGSVVRKWVQLDKPTLAALNGMALGGGANLALCCDMLLMREDASIAQNYVQQGLVVDMGGTWFLPRLVGRARAAELALLGDRVGAADAVAIGLANRCVPVDEWEATVADWGRRLATGAGRAQRMIKRALLRSPGMDLDTMLDWEALAMPAIFQTDDVREAFAAFAEKRPPRFTGR